MQKFACFRTLLTNFMPVISFHTPFLSFQGVYKETSDMKYVNNFVCKNGFKLNSCSSNILNSFLMSCCRVVAIVSFEEAFDWEALS